MSDTQPQPPLVLFLAHAADRTGPPIVLLHLLRWLRSNTDWRLGMVFLRGGELLDDFAAIGRCVVLGEDDPPASDGPGSRAARVRAEADRHHRVAALGLPDLVYLNTAWSIHALPYVPRVAPFGLVAAIHELDTDLRFTLSPSALADLMGRPDHFVTGAGVISRNLVDNYGVPPDRVTMVDEAIELPDLAGAAALDRAGEGVPAEAFVVTGAGSPVWRKGIDLFVSVAALLARRRPDLTIRFRWLGADEHAGHPDLVTPLADRERLGLRDFVTFVPPTDLVFGHLRLADAFLLSSREDASPLVCLEAAAAGLPVVCFDNGGIPDILGEGALVVPYPDLAGVVDALEALADDRSRAGEIGRTGRRIVNEHHDISRTAPLIRDVLAGFLP